MASQLGGNQFLFITTTDASLPRDPNVRAAIRKQAMSKAATARRRRGEWGKVNLRQYPPASKPCQAQSDELMILEKASVNCCSTPNAASGLIDLSTQEAEIGKGGLDADRAQGLSIPTKLSCTGYERMKIQYNFDLLDLSALTSFHAGRVTAQTLAEHPSRILNILSCRQWSYFDFLPSRFGHDACLDDAARCVAARVRQWMLSPTAIPDDGVLLLYSKALHSLQKALDDSNTNLEANILCATELLAIYEVSLLFDLAPDSFTDIRHIQLLDRNGSKAWSRHIAGATSLVELRGPERYHTEFEKALFMAQTGPIFTEALLNSQSCFLEQDSWQAVFQSVILETTPFSDRSDVVVSLWMSIYQLPRLLNEIEDVVCDTAGLDPEVIESLTDKIRHTRATLLTWRAHYESLLEHSDAHTSLAGANVDKRYETLGVGLAVLLLSSRMLVALGAEDAAQLEDTAQSLAHQLLALEQRTRESSPRAGVFMVFKSILAHATLATADEWKACVNMSNESGDKKPPLVSREAFRHWCDLKGRGKRAVL